MRSLAYRLTRFTVTLLLLVGGPPALEAATTSGVISVNETWSGTVSLTGDVTVGTDVTLTVLPGTLVRCDARADDRHAGANANRIELIVNGVLKAEGSPAAPITFTSWPVNPTDAPKPGDWQGIVLSHGTRSSSLSWCVVEYAIQALTASAAPPAISHCTVRDHQEYGILVRASLRLAHCTIERSGMGIQCDSQGSVPLELTDCVLRNNVNGIWNLPWCSTRITATRCLFEGNNYGADGHLAPNPVGSSFVGCTFSNNVTAALRSSHSDLAPVAATNSVFDGNGSAIIGGSGQAYWLVDCVIRNSKGPGIVDDFNASGVAIRAVRTTITRNGGPGIRHVHGPSDELVDCTISENAGAGIEAGSTVLTALRCSIVNNRGPGLFLKGVGAAGIHECVIQFNSVGLLFGGFSTGTIEDGLISTNNISRNGTFDVEQDQGRGGSIVYANGNYWGPETTAELVAGIRNLTRIHDSRDPDIGATVGPVVIGSWLSSWPPCTQPTAITAQPQDQSVPVGGSVTFSVAAVGQNLRYQWYHGPSAIQGAASARLVLTGIRSADQGEYRVVVSGDCGSPDSVTSRAARLVVMEPPRFTLHPEMLVEPAGATARWHVAAEGYAPISYRWKRNGAFLTDSDRVSGAATPDLVVGRIQASDVGEYVCEAANAAGLAVSHAGGLRLLEPPVIRDHPISAIVPPGEAVGFEVVAAGERLSYQWTFDGVAIPGATEPSLTIPSADLSSVGKYAVIVSNPAEPAGKRSNAASLGLRSLETCAVITLVGPVGERYRIEWSEPLHPGTWQTLTNVTLPYSPYSVVDFGSSHAWKRFYRTTVLTGP